MVLKQKAIDKLKSVTIPDLRICVEDKTVIQFSTERLEMFLFMDDNSERYVPQGSGLPNKTHYVSICAFRKSDEEYV